MARPKLAPEELKIKETIYLSPDVHKWLTDRSSKRDAPVGSLINVLCKERMLKDSK